jgi:hypothetical protein
MNAADGSDSPTLAAGILHGPGHYVDWGVVQISVANLVVIGLLVAIFVAGVLIPFPGERRRR